MHHPVGDIARFSVFEVDMRSGELRKGGVRIPLQQQPFRILTRLVERPGEVVTREELRQELWPADTYVDFEQGINAAVKRLREALGDSAETPRFIETLPRRGYRFIAPILADPTATASLATLEQPPPAPPIGPRVPQTPQKARFAFILAGSLSLSLGVGAATWMLSRVDRRPSAPTPRDLVSVLILDFQNHTGDPSFDGTIEEIVSSSVEDSSFITAFDRTSARRIAAQLPSNKRLDEAVGRAVAVRQGIEAIVAGTIELTQPGYLLSVTITDPSSGRVIGRVTANATASADATDAAESLGRSIRARLGDLSGELETVPPQRRGSLDAWRSLVLAREMERSRNSDGAIQYYRRAIEQDPKFARAYMSLFLHLRAAGQHEEAKVIGSTLQSVAGLMRQRERFRTLGAYCLVTGDYRGAAEHYKNLLSRYPDDVNGHNELAIVYFSLRDLPKALQAIRDAVEIFPRHGMFRTNYALFAMYASDFETAADEATIALSNDAEFGYAYIPLALAMLGKSSIEGARQAYARLAAQSAWLASLGLADLELHYGNVAEAEKILSSQITAAVTVPATSARAYALLGEVYVAEGKSVTAIEAVRKALDLHRDTATMVSAARVFLQAGRQSEALSLAAELARAEYREGLAYAKVIEADVVAQRHDLSRAIATLQLTDEGSDLWLRHFALALKFVEIGDYAKALSELNICEKRRGEATAIFFDDIPTFRYLRTLPYWFGRAQSGLGMNTQATDSFREFLRVQSSSASDTLVEDARRRLALLGTTEEPEIAFRRRP